MNDKESSRRGADFIMQQRNLLAQKCVTRVYEMNPHLDHYGPKGREYCLDDTLYHLSYLAEALATNSSEIFEHYAAWAKVMLEARGIPAADLALNFEALDFVMSRTAPPDFSDITHAYLVAGIDAMTRIPSGQVSIDEAGRNSALARGYLDTLLQQDRNQAVRLVLDAVDSGVSIREVYLDILQRTQHEIGRLWQTNKINVAQEHYCSAVTQLVMSQLFPRILSQTPPRKNRKVIVSAIQGDLHEIGARMVADFFEMEGWETVYVGANTPIGDLVALVGKDPRPQCLALSAAMSTHFTAIRRTIEAIRSEQANAKMRILVGGYAFIFIPELWRKLGADGYAENAAQAVNVAEAIYLEQSDASQ